MTKVLATEQLGRNLRQIRIDHGFTQEQTVAKLQLLGSPLSRSTFSLIEMGRGNIFVSDLVALQTVFQVDYEEFFRDIPPGRPGKSEE